MSAVGVAVRQTEVSDPALVAAVRAGDDGAFETLYRRYNARVTRFVRRFVRDEGRAEDVSQEAFVSALRRMRETDSAIDFKPWIHEIARNAAIDLHRRSSRTTEVSFDTENGLAPADAGRLTGPAGPEAQAVGHERFELLRGALDELSDTHSQIILLRELEGRSYREIGERLELTPAAVESALFRARRRLADEYAELDTGRRCRRTALLITRASDGRASEFERRRLDLHARRCAPCRRLAGELGVQIRPGVAARIAALLPLPAVLRRLVPGSDQVVATAPHSEPLIGAAKVAAVVVSAATLAAGGAGIGGVGPLAGNDAAGGRAPASQSAASLSATESRHNALTAPKVGARAAVPATRQRTKPKAATRVRSTSGSRRAAATTAPARIDTPAAPPVPAGIPTRSATPRTGSSTSPSAAPRVALPSVPKRGQLPGTPKVDLGRVTTPVTGALPEVGKALPVPLPTGVVQRTLDQTVETVDGVANGLLAGLGGTAAP